MKKYNLISLFLFLFSFNLMAVTSLSPLIDSHSLFQTLKNKNLVLLDIRNSASYAKGHIKGSVHSPYKKWRVAKDGIIGLLPEPNHVQDLIQKAGIHQDSLVVIIFGNVRGSDFGSAARVYWTLKIAGLKNISILDGGLRLWQENGFSMDTHPVSVTPSSYKVKEFNKKYLVHAENVKSFQENENILLLDARPENQYQGYSKHRKSKYGGTIPSSKNFSQFNMFNQNGTIVEPVKLQSMLNDFSIDKKEQTISFCNTGHWAATNWFVLSEVLGKDGVKLYDGSMVDWTNKSYKTDNQRNRFELWWNKITN